VDGFGWSADLRDGVGWVRNVVAFPYWQAWHVPVEEDRFYNIVAPPPHGGGVFVCFPGKTPNHRGESQNRLEKGVWPLDLMIKRWKKARCHGSTYLAIGDGFRHIQGEYLPDTAQISDNDITKIRQEVFSPHCESHTEEQPQQPPSGPGPASQPIVVGDHQAGLTQQAPSGVAGVSMGSAPANNGGAAGSSPALSFFIPMDLTGGSGGISGFTWAMWLAWAVPLAGVVALVAVYLQWGNKSRQDGGGAFTRAEHDAMLSHRSHRSPDRSPRDPRESRTMNVYSRTSQG
jgi:hypothetical protein